MSRHWSDEGMHCLLCGKTFRSAMAEARHRHNAPMLCRKPRAAKPSRKADVPAGVATRGV